jgi:hypothetical protein
MTNNSDNTTSGRNHTNQTDIPRPLDFFLDTLGDREKIAFMELMFLLFLSRNQIRFIEEGHIAELLEIDEVVLRETIKKAIAHGVLQLTEKAVVARSEKEIFRDSETNDLQPAISSKGTGRNPKPWARYKCLSIVNPESDFLTSDPNQNDFDKSDVIGHIIELLANRVFDYYDQFGPDSDINWGILETSPISTGLTKNLPTVILYYDDTKGDLNKELLDKIDGGLALWSANMASLVISTSTARTLHLARLCRLYFETNKALKTSPGHKPLSIK